MWDFSQWFMVGFEDLTDLTSGCGAHADIVVGLFIQPALLCHFDFSLLLNEAEDVVVVVVVIIIIIVEGEKEEEKEDVLRRFGQNVRSRPASTACEVSLKQLNETSPL